MSNHAHSFDLAARRKSLAISQMGILDIASGNVVGEDDELEATSSSLINFYPKSCERCCKHKTVGSGKDSIWEQMKHPLVCPPIGFLGKIYTFFTIYILLCLVNWVVLMDVYGPDRPSPGAPRGPVFALETLEIIGLFAGIFCKGLRLPYLMGPLLLGILIRNFDSIDLFAHLASPPHFNCSHYSFAMKSSHNSFVMKSSHFLSFQDCKTYEVTTKSHWIRPIRELGLMLILTRAGLELSPKQLKKLKLSVPCLAFCPCVMEALTCTAATYVCFHVLADKGNQISIFMCFVAGFALAAVSPAVVVPSILSLKKKGYGIYHGVNTLLIAAASIDDVLAITMFTFFLSLAVPHGHESKEKESSVGNFLFSFAGIVIGIVSGIIIGVLLHFIPPRDNKRKAPLRLLMLLLFNACSIIGFDRLERFESASSLSVLTTSFIASFGWRSQPHWKKPMKRIEKRLSQLWTLFVPVLFGTIGNEIRFSDPGFSQSNILKIFGIIGVSLTVRCLVAFAVTFVCTFTIKERVFIAFAWIPKATVQAALAPLALTAVRARAPGDVPLEIHAQVVVSIAVTALTITAPLGSVLIGVLGPKLLQKTYDESVAIDSEFPFGDEQPTDLVEISELESEKRIPKNDEVELKNL